MTDTTVYGVRECGDHYHVCVTVGVFDAMDLRGGTFENKAAADEAARRLNDGEDPDEVLGRPV